MNGIRYTNLLFEVGEYSSEKGEDPRWIPREDRGYTLLFKTSMEEISHSVLLDRMCRKIAIDGSKTKVKLSYISMVVKPHRRVYVTDDEDVHAYLNSVDKELCRSVLHLEIPVGKNQRGDDVSRIGEKSSVGVNDVRDDVVGNDEVDGRDDDGVNNVDNDVDNAGVLDIYVEKEPIQQHNEQREDVDIGDDDNVHDGGELYSSSFDDHYELPRVLSGCEYIDEWEDGMGLQVGQEFPSNKEIKDLVARASIKNCFGFHIAKSDRKRYVVRCCQAREGCSWYLRAAKVPQSMKFSVRVYHGKHRCSRAVASTSMKKTRGTPRLVASILHEDYPGCFNTPTPKSIVGLVQSRLGVEVSYSTALRGKHQAVYDVRGNPEECYQRIYQYLYMLEKVNPGTVTMVELDGEKKFKYMFVALGACIEGFQAMRKVIIVDATFLKTSYEGMLVFATAQDPNHHHYPLAFGIIDGENNESWRWFFEALKTVIPDNPELVFVSDRHPSIIKGVSDVFPSSEHGYCIYHLSQNVKGTVRWNKDLCAEHFMMIAKIYTEGEFREAYSDFRSRYPAAAVYLDKHVEEDKWAKCLFKGTRYDVDTSNTVESMNSVFRDARKYSLLPMIDEIMKTFSRWFNEHRKEAVSVSSAKKLVPLVENIMHTRCRIATHLPVSEVNSYTHEYCVITGEGMFSVDLERKSCSCRCFDIDKYPCEHAIAAVIKLHGSRESPPADLDFHDMCSKYYLMETWVLAYCRAIYRVPHMAHWCIPEYIKELVVHPAKKKKDKNKGRNQETRFPSAGERRRRRRKKRTSNKSRPDQDLGVFLRSQTEGEESEGEESDGEEIDGEESDGEESDGEESEENGGP